MLLEFVKDRADAPQITIYGTDINEQSLAKARSGIYSEYALKDVSEERITRFFTPVEAGFKVSKRVRELCVFAAHDVTRDPPYSRIDLLTCCNVMIYFDSELQKKAVASLQYALAPGGFLMLGSSENLRAEGDHLKPVSAKPLIYRKLEGVRTRVAIDFASRKRRQENTARAQSARLRSDAVENAGETEDDSFLSSQLAPAGVLINARMEITKIRGDVSEFLALEPGNVSFDVFNLLRHHELLPILRGAVRTALEDRGIARRDGIV